LLFDVISKRPVIFGRDVHLFDALTRNHSGKDLTTHFRKEASGQDVVDISCSGIDVRTTFCDGVDQRFIVSELGPMVLADALLDLAELQSDDQS